MLYAYNVCRTPSEIGQKVSEELKKLGIKGIIHNGLKSNRNGITTMDFCMKILTKKELEN